MDGQTERQAYFEEFEQEGEVEIRRQVAAGEFSSRSIVFAREWLAGFDNERDAASAKRAAEIAEEQLRLASDANDHADQANAIAKRANTIAIAASIIAVAAMAVSIVTAVMAS